MNKNSNFVLHYAVIFFSINILSCGKIACYVCQDYAQSFLLLQVIIILCEYKTSKVVRVYTVSNKPSSQSIFSTSIAIGSACVLCSYILTSAINALHFRSGHVMFLNCLCFLECCCKMFPIMLHLCSILPNYDSLCC